MSECHDYQIDADGYSYCSRCGVQQAAEGEVILVYHYRGQIRAIVETAKDAEIFVSKQTEPPSEFYTERWDVKYYE